MAFSDITNPITMLFNILGFQSVWEAKNCANDAKANAMEVLIKSNRSRERVEQSNEQLRDLIREIRDLLTNDKADVSVIEAVSNEVLALEMPTSTEKLQELTKEIRDKVATLTSVESILNQSAADIKEAEVLLRQAEVASFLCGVDFQILEAENGRKIKTRKNQHPMDAIQLAQNNTKGTQELLIAEFEEGVKDKFGQVKEHVEDRGDAVLQARRRADELQLEAKELLVQTSIKLERLGELEGSYESNQLILETKAAELAQLEEAVRLLLDEISHKVTLYSTCV
ncbi:laminin subunit beta-1-like isoform X1 [Gouania willdenowi]|uniref:laminin subunit beta-1-like isoform X1 n=2 Tax=Gouania willdenowi TaxID=441366 RepID=UPI001056C937|nr:laminin subunit beta-1-like isoform X1 [Gouania willdenowi]